MKRWRNGRMMLRWTVTAIAEAVTRFRRATGARSARSVAEEVELRGY